MKYFRKTDKDRNPMQWVMEDGTHGLTLSCEAPLAMNMVGYGLIHKDLSACKSCLLEYLKLDDAQEILCWAITISFYTTYGKCFAKAEGRRVKLEKDVVSQPLKIVHQQIIEARNKYAAHGGGYEEGGYSLVGLHPNEETRMLPVVAPPISFCVNKIVRENIPFYQKLVEELLAYTNAKIEEKRLALEAWVRKLNVSELYSIHNEQ